MKIYSVTPKYKHKALIDITPLVDLVFLLIIFFMVSSSLGKLSAISVNLPTAQKSGDSVAGQNIITITKNDEIFINDVKTDLNNLDAEIQNRAADLNKSPVIIRGDKDSKYDLIIKVMDSLNKSGISKFTLSTIKSL